MSAFVPPEDYSTWPQDRRNKWFADAAKAYDERRKPERDGSPSNSPAWPSPKPLPDGLPRVPNFAPDYLPEAIRPWAEDIAERMQCPLDFIGATALVALGGAIGRRVAVRPQRATDWTELPNIWGVIVGRPGAMKSPAMTEALKPLHRIEAKAREENGQAAVEFERANELHQLMFADARDKARKQLKGGGSASLDIGPAPTPPPRRRHIVNDTSYEALGEILAQNPNGVLVVRDELISLLRSLDREEFAAARGFYLSAWNGTGDYTFDPRPSRLSANSISPNSRAWHPHAAFRRCPRASIRPTSSSTSSRV